VKKLVGVLLAALLVLSLAACAKKEAAAGADSGKVYELAFSMHTAAESPIGQYYQAMFDDIEKRTNGKVKVTVHGSGTLAPAPAVVDMVRDGGCDIGWVFTSFYFGQYPLSDVIAVPLQDAETCQQGTKVLWDLYEKYPKMADEWKDFHVLTMYGNPVSYVYSKDPIAKISDLRGKTIRSTSGGVAEVLKAWGANVISAPPIEIFDGMSKGVMQGYTFEPTGIVDYSLGEVTPYVTDLLLYQGPFVTVMNKGVYESLPKEYQAAFDAWTGREASLKFAQMFQDYTDKCMNDFLAKSKKVSVSAADRAEFQKAADAFAATWAKQYTTEDFDALAYYNFCRDAYKKYAK
jgi:TRAP-type C4-dicarboxylate transport system substrate-binding protein